VTRIFAILILVLLPLQWSYAAVASYCGHEKLPKGQGHLGHHELASTPAKDLPDGPAPDNGDECPVCIVATFNIAMDVALAIHDPFPDLPFRPPQGARRIHPA